MRNFIPLDAFEINIPPKMRSYLRNYQYHFSKKACDFAISRMKRINPATGKKEAVEKQTKEQIEDILMKYGVKLEHNEGYDFVYLWHMAKADFLKSSIADEQHLALFVRDAIEDADMIGSNAFRHWLADCDALGVAVEWEDMM